MQENKMEDRNYVVYKHTSPSGKVYIGITGQNPPEKRWANGRGYEYNEYFSRAIFKYSWQNFSHEILIDNLTQQEAEQKEIELIAYYKSADRNFGYNLDLGGNYAGKHSEETKRKLSALKMGHEVSDEVRKKVSESNSVNIIKYSMSGVFLRKYNSITEAANDNNLSNTAISNCCRNITKTAGGYIWRYENDVLTDSYLKWCNNKNTDRISLRKMVIQYSKSGEFIKEYDSINIASLETGVNEQNISMCCAGKNKTAGGYIWRYSNEKITEEYLQWCNYDEKQNNCVKVLQYSIDGIFIAEYNSILLAAESVNCKGCSIVSCCKGRTKTCCGYIWRYADDENNEFRQAI